MNQNLPLFSQPKCPMICTLFAPKKHKCLIIFISYYNYLIFSLKKKQLLGMIGENRRVFFKFNNSPVHLQKVHKNVRPPRNQIISFLYWYMDSFILNANCKLQKKYSLFQFLIFIATFKLLG